jgi:hypothetical protein
MKTLYRSFAGGEIAPELYGRIDLTKRQTALQKALNALTLPHGPAARRPGFAYVNRCAVGDASWLIPFAYSTSQSLVLEFSSYALRFHNADGALLESTKNIVAATNASPGVFTVLGAGHGWLSGDKVFIPSSIGGWSDFAGQFFQIRDVPSVTTFSLSTLDGDAVSTASLPAFSGSGPIQRVYTLTSPISGDRLPFLRFIQNADVLTLFDPSGPTYELRRLGATNWTFTQLDFTPTLAAPTGVTATATKPTATNVTAQHYVVTAVASDGVTESLQSSDATDTNNLTIAGNFNTIAWSAVTGAARYFVYKLRGGAYGYVGQTTGLSLVDENILPDTLTTPPSDTLDLNTGATNYPTCGAYYEQRRWFANTAEKPQTVFATRNGTESNLTSSIPSRADDGLEFRIAAQQQNAIQHLVPLNDMIALTNGGCFRIFADGQPFITPTSLSIKPQGGRGAGSNYVQPAITPNSALYVQALGARVREVAYDPQGQGFYRTVDASLFAPHLFDGYTITQLAFVSNPEPVLYAVRSDGVLLGCTYLPEQSVLGWHQHTTQNGRFMSICVIPEDDLDVLYAVIAREINGRSVEYIERMTPRVVDRRRGRCSSSTRASRTTAVPRSPRSAVSRTSRARRCRSSPTARTPATRRSSTARSRSTTAASKVTIGLGYNSDIATLPAYIEGRRRRAGHDEERVQGLPARRLLLGGEGGPDLRPAHVLPRARGQRPVRLAAGAAQRRAQLRDRPELEHRRQQCACARTARCRSRSCPRARDAVRWLKLAVRTPTGDVGRLVAGMRAADVPSCHACGLMDRAAVVRQSVSGAAFCHAFVVDGELAGIGGLGRWPGGEGCPWFLGTPVARRRARSLMRTGRCLHCLACCGCTPYCSTSCTQRTPWRWRGLDT